jgi:hypothetical protein
MSKAAKKTPTETEAMKEHVFPKTITPASVQLVKGPQYSAFYCNNVSFAVNVLEFVLTFGEAIEASPENAVVEQRARVTMHPTQAKVMAFLLLKNIEGYEQINGTILVPPGATGIPPNSPHK